MFAKDYGKRKSEYEAKFYNSIDKNLLNNGQKPSWMSDEDFIKYQETGEEPTLFQTPIGEVAQPSINEFLNVSREGNNRLYGKKFWDKQGESSIGAAAGMPVIRTAAHVLGAGSSDMNKVDATGSITLPDGTKVSYKKLHELSKYKKGSIEDRNKKLQIESTHEEFPLEKSKNVIKHPEYGNISEEAYEDHEQHADQVLMSWGYEGRFDAKLLEIKEQVELIEAGKMIVKGKLVDIKTDEQKREAELKLKHLNSARDEITSMKGYEQFYDPETGERINYSKGEWIDQGDGTEINNESGVRS